MTLKDYLAASVSTGVITVKLYDENDLLLISFNLQGYHCLDDELENRTIKSWTINSLTSISVVLNPKEEP